jgi:hypothetical protein
MENDSTQSILSGAMQQEQNHTEIEHRIQLEKKRKLAHSSRMNETNEQRQKRLEKNREGTRSSRTDETEEQRQKRLEKDREGTRSSRIDETEEQRQKRLEKDREGTRSSRTDETEERRQNRLEQQRKRSQANRKKKKLEKRASDNSAIRQQNSDMQLSETEDHASCDGDSMSDLTQNGNVVKKKKSSISPPWPEPISRDLKETRLKQFLQRMTMSALAEVTCAVCNIRTPVEKSKKLSLSKIPHIDLLKVSDQLKDLIISTQSSTLQNSNGSNIQMADHDQSNIYNCQSLRIHIQSLIILGSSTLNSSSFYCENGIILYPNGLSQQNNMNMCTLCQKCYDALSKGQTPKFSPANDMWLGDVPTELQGLTIPEEKLISLYRHNSCIIKLHSPFHSTTTAQAALKGNCISFLQNVPNIVNSLPLTLDDLCDTLKVIFVGARPPERIHLRKILTVRKKKIIQALHWLKRHNVLYRNIEINLKNIAQLPEDDVPECIMSTMEQKIGDDEIQSERVGYVPDPLSDPTEYTTSNTIPINNR